MDADGTVIEFNAAAERTFGYTKAEAIGRPLADLIIPPRFRARASPPAWRVTWRRVRAAARQGHRDHRRAIGRLGNSGGAGDHGDSLGAGADLHRCVARHHRAQARRRHTAPSGRDRRFVGRRDLQHGLDDTILTWNAGAERLRVHGERNDWSRAAPSSCRRNTGESTRSWTRRRAEKPARPSKRSVCGRTGRSSTSPSRFRR